MSNKPKRHDKMLTTTIPVDYVKTEVAISINRESMLFSSTKCDELDINLYVLVEHYREASLQDILSEAVKKASTYMHDCEDIDDD